MSRQEYTLIGVSFGGNKNETHLMDNDACRLSVQVSYLKTETLENSQPHVNPIKLQAGGI